MAREYVPIFLDWPTVTRELNAQEKGRLIDAIVAYQAGGDWQEQIKGNERYTFPGYQVRIDHWNEVSSVRSKAVKGEQTNTNANKLEQTDTNRSKRKQTVTNENKPLKDKEKEEVKDYKEKQEKESAAEDGYPFGLMEDDIQATLELDRRIEDAARDVGLTVSVKALDKARELARMYGADELIQAIGDAYDKPSWPYVIGILKRRSEEVKAQPQPSADDSEAVNWYDG